MPLRISRWATSRNSGDQMIAAGFPRHAAFVAAVASACNDQMFGIPWDVVWGSDAVTEIRPVVANQRGRSPRLLAAANLEAERESGREVVAREAAPDRHVPELAARPDPHQRQPDVSDQAARVGDHEVPVRSEDTHPPVPVRDPQRRSVRLRRR